MTKEKYILALFFSLILVLSLTGCSTIEWDKANSLIDLIETKPDAETKQADGESVQKQAKGANEDTQAAGQKKPAAQKAEQKPQKKQAATNEQIAAQETEKENAPGEPTPVPEDEPASEEDAPKRVEVTLDRLIDGDTFAVKIGDQVEKVRFLLIDTPETNHPKLGEQPFGQEAKEFTAEKVKNAQKLELEFDVSERDKYGRLLAYVYVDGESLQEMLLAEGLARVAYVYPPNVKYVDQYREIQKQAQEKGVGIWSIENYAQDDGFHPEVITEG